MSNKERFSFADIQKIIDGNDHYEIFQFPGFTGADEKIAIKVLTQRESDMATKDTELRFMKDKDYIGSEFRATIAFAKEAQRQGLLYAVCHVPEKAGDKLEPFFDSVEDIDKLDLNITDMLVEFFSRVQEKFNPTTKIRDDKELQEVIDEIKKNSAIGLSLSTTELVALLSFLVNHPETLQKDSGSLPSPSKTEETKSEPKQPKSQAVAEITPL